MTKKEKYTINKDINLLETYVSKCNTEAFPLGIIIASDIEIALSDKSIDLKSRDILRGKLNDLAVKFHINCSCVSDTNKIKKSAKQKSTKRYKK